MALNMMNERANRLWIRQTENDKYQSRDKEQFEKITHTQTMRESERKQELCVQDL